eukprot:TRINITY_DN3402_c0_g2_i1.p1 TRINITY_DN3402_c0_g2~~TRINITY_DN3402_c0_g2_i1.p1  ORF type:complete len:911 (+),score=177.52 TRINITY_DN3402_c0_g2_i1:77-2809(+)
MPKPTTGAAPHLAADRELDLQELRRRPAKQSKKAAAARPQGTAAGMAWLSGSMASPRSPRGGSPSRYAARRGGAAASYTHQTPKLRRTAAAPTSPRRPAALTVEYPAPEPYPPYPSPEVDTRTRLGRAGRGVSRSPLQAEAVARDAANGDKTRTPAIWRSRSAPKTASATPRPQYGVEVPLDNHFGHSLLFPPPLMNGTGRSARQPLKTFPKHSHVVCARPQRRSLSVQPVMRQDVCFGPAPERSFARNGSARSTRQRRGAPRSAAASREPSVASARGGQRQESPRRLGLAYRAVGVDPERGSRRSLSVGLDDVQTVPRRTPTRLADAGSGGCEEAASAASPAAAEVVAASIPSPAATEPSASAELPKGTPGEQRAARQSFSRPKQPPNETLVVRPARPDRDAAAEEPSPSPPAPAPEASASPAPVPPTVSVWKGWEVPAPTPLETDSRSQTYGGIVPVGASSGTKAPPKARSGTQRKVSRTQSKTQPKTTAPKRKGSSALQAAPSSRRGSRLNSTTSLTQRCLTDAGTRQKKEGQHAPHKEEARQSHRRGASPQRRGPVASASASGTDHDDGVTDEGTDSREERSAVQTPLQDRSGRSNSQSGRAASMKRSPSGLGRSPSGVGRSPNGRRKTAPDLAAAEDMMMSPSARDVGLEYLQEIRERRRAAKAAAAQSPDDGQTPRRAASDLHRHSPRWDMSDRPWRTPPLHCVRREKVDPFIRTMDGRVTPNPQAPIQDILRCPRRHILLPHIPVEMENVMLVGGEDVCTECGAPKPIMACKECIDVYFLCKACKKKLAQCPVVPRTRAPAVREEPATPDPLPLSRTQTAPAAGMRSPSMTARPSRLADDVPVLKPKQSKLGCLLGTLGVAGGSPSPEREPTALASADDGLVGVDEVVSENGDDYSEGCFSDC